MEGRASRRPDEETKRGRGIEPKIGDEARMTSVAPETGGPPPALLRALRHLLRPLVKLLLANQVTHPVLSGLLKSIYLEIAERHFALEGKRQTASRLSLLTGLHRKDVKRLREEPLLAVTAPPPSVSLGARLVARWLGEPDFQDAEGRPLPLPRVAVDGPSFETLVTSVSTDIRPRAVLDEWLRLGVVDMDAEDRVALRVEAFVPREGFEEKAHYLGRNVHDHLAAAVHNLSGEGPPLLERSVYYDGLSAESIRELQELSEKQGMQALRAVNRRALALQRRDAKRGEPKLRMNFGIYFYKAEKEDAPEEGEGDDE